ncbi:FAD dependent oxidoreductase [Halobacillus karajensis]|nr:FAD dependent oxidoreductase [Halobacillus karajensis]
MEQQDRWTKPEPLWREEISLPKFEALNEDKATEVAIVGGGITGITTAYLLAKAGKKVTLLEADELMNGTTGHTTAKVTAQHGLIYNELIQHFGEEEASLYYQAQMDALQSMEEWVKKYEIDCNWEKEDAYLYATTQKGAHKLEKEFEAYQKLGIPGGTQDALPFDVETTKALSMKNQARFHPIKYLLALIKEFTKMGGKSLSIPRLLI